jgi:transcription elongation GreA/GreB family factor
MLSIKEINQAIMFGSFTNEELTSIGEAIRYYRAQLTKQTKRNVTVGSTVKFTHPKTGRVHTGSVLKIKIKNITVLENGVSKWNVPANMLEVVA